MVPPVVRRVSDDDLELLGLTGEVNACVLLAAAVVKRAFKDLIPTTHIASQWWQWDAYDFLTNRLWEVDNVWRQILEHTLVRHMILHEVDVRLNGQIPTKPSKLPPRYMDP